jgi:cation diffusion facilitator family transporter
MSKTKQRKQRDEQRAAGSRSTPDEARADAARQAARGARAALWAMLVSAVLGTVKVVTGVVGHSYALIADGVESMLDIGSSLLVWGSLKAASIDPSKRFPYGYGKVEALAGLAIAVGLLLAAIGLAVQSVREILNPHEAPAWYTLAVLVAVVAVKTVLSRSLLRTGEEIGSRSVESDAWHHWSDAATSLAAAIGIGIALWGGPGWESADDWAALAACGLIAFNGFRQLRGALAEVLDAAPDDKLIKKIRATAEQVEGVTAIEKVRARKSGLGWLVDIHVEVDGDLAVREGHRLAHEVQETLLGDDIGVLDALVHIEPAGER